MFDVQIRPILEYAHVIWYNAKTMNENEKIYLSYMKETLNVKDHLVQMLFMQNLRGSL